jgi:GNAT superfamily N-acetyltransferase
VTSDAEIDRFLQEQARAEQALMLSQGYVAVVPQSEVLAYFTLSPVTVRVDATLLAKLGVDVVAYPAIGGFLLGRLGVHKSLQHQGVGEALVTRAAQIAKMETEVVGGAFLAVDPKTEPLVCWYSKQDFTSSAPLRRGRGPRARLA